jgi:hypothetical protein
MQKSYKRMTDMLRTEREFIPQEHNKEQQPAKRPH